MKMNLENALWRSKTNGHMKAVLLLVCLVLLVPSLIVLYLAATREDESLMLIMIIVTVLVIVATAAILIVGRFTGLKWSVSNLLFFVREDGLFFTGVARQDSYFFAEWQEIAGYSAKREKNGSTTVTVYFHEPADAGSFGKNKWLKMVKVAEFEKLVSIFATYNIKEYTDQPLNESEAGSVGIFQGKQMKSATLTLNARLQPMDRGEYYEESLDKVLKEAQIGEVNGGGTEFTQEEGPLRCDVGIEFDADKKEELIGLLKAMPAPVGSKLTIDESDETYEIGDLEGMAVYLNGTELDKEVYEKCDVNFVISELSKCISEDLAFFSYWQGNKETALYFYGKSYERMKEATAEFISTYPLCQKCRIVQIA